MRGGYHDVGLAASQRHLADLVSVPSIPTGSQ